MKVKIFLVAILACLLIPCFVACSKNGDVFENSAKKGLTCKITYDFGDGTVGGRNSMIYLVAPNSPAPELGVTDAKPATTAPSLTGHRIAGYFVKNEDGTEREWNFATDRVTGDVTLYVRWKPDYNIRVVYGSEQERSYTLAVTSDDYVMKSFREVEWEGHTFYGFYSDPEFEHPITFPYTAAVSDETPTVTVYAKYIEGKFTIIRRAADFGKSIKAGVNYYIDADIDLTGINMTVGDSYSGKFIGNGHTIKGLTVTRKQGKNTTVYGLFSEITKTAVFENITFEDVSVSVELNNDQNNQINYIGTFAGAVQSGATFTGVTIKGALTYNCFGRDLADKLEVNDLFGEVDPGVDISGITATVTATEVTG